MGAIRIRVRQRALTANVTPLTAKAAPAFHTATSTPAAAGPAMIMRASTTRRTALARCTSGAMRGMVEATPGWKRAAPTPLRTERV